jgi:ribosome-binding factor A
MASRRIERFNEQLKREITVLVREEVRDPRIGMTTVTAVEASADFSVARVYVSIMGDEAVKEESLEGLRAAAPFIRTELGRLLRVRRVPELRFELDRSLEYALKIERLLHEALPERGAPEPAPGEERPPAPEERDEE